MKKIMGILMILVCASQHAFAATGHESGGGGFFKKSPKELEDASASAASHLLKVDPKELASIMPPSWQTEGWTRERLASVLWNVCDEQTKIRERNDEALVFDHCDGNPNSSGCQNPACANMKTNGQYISALLPYFAMSEANGYGKDLEVALLHEAVHLLDVGINPDNDSDAEVLAKKIKNLKEVKTANDATLPAYTGPYPELGKLNWGTAEFDCEHLNVNSFNLAPKARNTYGNIPVAGQSANLKYVFKRTGAVDPRGIAGLEGQVTVTITTDDGTVLTSLQTDQAWMYRDYITHTAVETNATPSTQKLPYSRTRIASYDSEGVPFEFDFTDSEDDLRDGAWILFLRVSGATLGGSLGNCKFQIK